MRSHCADGGCALLIGMLNEWYLLMFNVTFSTNRDQMTDVLQHHILKQLSLGCVQQGPLFPSEVYNYILEGHGIQ